MRESTGAFNAASELRFANSIDTPVFHAVPSADEEQNAEPDEGATTPPVKSSTCTIAWETKWNAERQIYSSKRLASSFSSAFHFLNKSDDRFSH